MKATITKAESKPDSKMRGRSIVYVETPLNEVVDEWFDENNISSLDFKCRTWNKVARLATSHVPELLKELFPDAINIKFSETAGCSCGCSPGYVLKYEDNVYGRSYWANLEVSESELEEFKAEVASPKYLKELLEELES